jgi:hypothetical protein
MVICELLSSTGAGGYLARWPSKLLRPLYGLSESGAMALVMGVLFGYPVGAKMAADCYRAGRMSECELQYVLCFCHFPSAAFLVGTLGGALFGSAAVGRVLLGICWGSGLAVGLLLRPLLGKGERKAGKGAQPPAAGAPPAVLLPRAITCAASSMLSVCATVVLFCGLVGALEDYADALAIGGTWRGALLGFLELSGGVGAAAQLHGAAAVVLCAAMVGWGGISVHCQILAVCDGCPVRLGLFWLARTLHGALCAGGAYLALRLGWLDVPSRPPLISSPCIGEPAAVGILQWVLCALVVAAASARYVSLVKGRRAA